MLLEPGKVKKAHSQAASSGYLASAVGSFESLASWRSRENVGRSGIARSVSSGREIRKILLHFKLQCTRERAPHAGACLCGFLPWTGFHRACGGLSPMPDGGQTL
jgi:hypothetical protein